LSAWPKSLVFGHDFTTAEDANPVFEASSVGARWLSLQFFPNRGATPSWLKWGRLSNLGPNDADELDMRAISELTKVRDDQSFVRNLFHASDLPLPRALVSCLSIAIRAPRPLAGVRLSRASDFVFGFSTTPPENPRQRISEFGRGLRPRVDATGGVGNAIGTGEAETLGEGAERFLGLPWVGPSGDGACKVRITAARKIVGLEPVMAHNCVAGVVTVESSQRLRFRGRCEWVTMAVLDHPGPISRLEHVSGAPSSPSGRKSA
jgi:hypothetical protein